MQYVILTKLTAILKLKETHMDLTKKVDLDHATTEVIYNVATSCNDCHMKCHLPTKGIKIINDTSKTTY